MEKPNECPLLDPVLTAGRRVGFQLSGFYPLEDCLRSNMAVSSYVTCGQGATSIHDLAVLQSYLALLLLFQVFPIHC